ncbi:tRNA (guanine(10)-N2)-methyltransferase [Acrasis kona]|uniref:tRNA (Guanine(10)-N2)-methyltransferase n=1 Tax=Acrasis kona TaxID=1008807 RepID=A0AAW2ZGX2_9EUKA
MPPEKKKEALSWARREHLYKESWLARIVITGSFPFAVTSLLAFDMYSFFMLTLLFLVFALLIYYNMDLNEVHPKYIVVNKNLWDSASCEFIIADAFKWLDSIDEIPGFLATSLPDYLAMGMTLEQWRPWFIDTAVKLLQKLPDQSLALFYQTDAKIRQSDGGPTDKKKQTEWVDKGMLLQQAASQVQGVKLVWHKIIDKTKQNASNKSKMGYSHLLCFGKNRGVAMHRDDMPDVVDRGELIYKNSISVNACLIAAILFKEENATCVVDPFCGRGSFNIAANYVGIKTIGIDINSGCIKQAKIKLVAARRLFARYAQNCPFVTIKEVQ